MDIKGYFCVVLLLCNAGYLFAVSCAVREKTNARMIRSFIPLSVKGAIFTRFVKHLKYLDFVVFQRRLATLIFLVCIS